MVSGKENSEETDFGLPRNERRLFSREFTKGGFSKGGFSNDDMIIAHKLLNPPLLNPPL